MKARVNQLVIVNGFIYIKHLGQELTEQANQKVAYILVGDFVLCQSGLMLVYYIVTDALTEYC